MMNERLNKLKLNSILGIIYQVTLVLVNFILPRFFLKYYGSNVNGLISSITQFLSIINLCDMGISAVISSALYKPLAVKDEETVSKILAFARKFFRIVGIILLIYIFALTFIFPMIVKKNFSFIYTITLLWAMSISQFGQYFIGITYQLLLTADQRSYVQLSINTVTLIINSILAVLIMTSGGSVQTVKLMTSVVFLLRPIYMYFYVRRNYKINYSIVTDGSVVPQKRSGIIQHISYMIYGNTDVVVLTFLSTLSNVSIYSVYVLVNNGVKSFVSALTTGFQAMFGNLIANNETEKLKEMYDFYDWFLHTFCVFVYVVTGIMIVPFVLTYTAGIKDANYNVPIFAFFITLAYLINTIREGMYIMIRASGDYQQTQIASVLEAALNLTISIIFVFKFGIVGVAIGTLIATTFFTIYEMKYLTNNILARNSFKFIKQILIDIISVILMIIATRWIKITQYTYLVWFKNALIVACLCFVISVLVQSIFYRDNLLLVYRQFKKIVTKRRG